MKSFRWTIPALAAVALLATVSIHAEEAVWVSSEGHVSHIGDHNVMFVGEHEGAEVFDLADLMEGESRIFGSGERQLTVTRSGDDVTLTRPETDEDAALSVTCRLSTDSCQVLTFAADPEKVMIMIGKERHCVDGVGDCDISIDDFTGGEGQAIVIRSTVKCDDAGDCEVTEELINGGEDHVTGSAFTVETLGEGGAGENVFIMKHGGGGDGVNVFVTADDRVSLRCPEGDTTMRITKDEADAVYLCPKHSTPLERLETPAAGIRTLSVAPKKLRVHKKN